MLKGIKAAATVAALLVATNPAHAEELRIGTASLGGAFYPMLAHDSAIVEGYLRAADRALDHVADSIDGDRVHSDLRGPIAHAGFQRLT